jgi:hypothetical protein
MEQTPAAPKSALTGLKAAIGLIDDVDPALSAHQAIIAVPAAQGFQGIADFHDNLGLLLFAGYIRSRPSPVNASRRAVVRGAALLYSPEQEFKPCNAAVTVS